MIELRITGEEDLLRDLSPRLVAAGFSLVSRAPLFLHIGSLESCSRQDGQTGLLIVSAITPAEFEWMASGAGDVVTRAAEFGEVVARLRSLAQRARSTTPGIRLTADLIEHLLDGVVVVDAHGHVLQMNETATRVLDLPENGAGKILIDLARPVHAPQRDNLIRSIRAGEVLLDVDAELQLQSGRRITVALSSGPLHEGPGRAVISFRDVTVARRTEMELRRTRDFLHHLVEGSSDAIVASDMRGRLVVFNAAAERMFGVSAEEARQKLSVIEIYPEGGAREMMRLLRDAPSGHIESVRTYGITQKGELVPIEVSASLVKMNGDEVATVGVLRDLRERVRVESELARARAKLSDVEKQSAVTALAGATAHELNQPLTVIFGYLDLLRRRTDEAHRKPIEAITMQAERMAEIVKKIARLTHVEMVAYPGRRQIADLEKTPEPHASASRA